MARKLGIDELNRQLNQARYVSTTPGYSDALSKALRETYEYGMASDQNRLDVANTIIGGGNMTSLNTGDTSGWNFDNQRQTELDRVQSTKFFRDMGLFDTRDYATNKGYTHMASLGYLNSLLPTLQAEIEASQQKDLDMDALKQQTAETSARWFDLMNASNDTEMDRWYNMLMADYLLGDRNELFDFEAIDARYGEMSDEEYEREYQRLTDQWNGLDWETLTGGGSDNYESQTSTLQGHYKTVSNEVARRTEMEALQGSIRSEADYGTLSAYNDTYVAPEKGTLGYIFSNEPFIQGYDDLSRFMNAGGTWAEKTIAAEYSPTVQGYLEKGYDYLTADELADYNYLIASGRTEDAAHYLELLRPELLYRRAMVLKEYQTVKATNPGLAVPTWVDAGIQQIENVFNLPVQIYETWTGQDNPYSAAWDAYNKSQWTSEAQIDWIQDADTAQWVKDTATFLYKGASGARDNFTRLVASGFNPTGALILAGAQSTSGSLHESAERNDMSAAAKIIKAIGTGAIEVGTEKIGLDALFDRGQKGALEYLLGSMGAEIGEETLNAMSEPVLEAVVAFLFDHEAEIMSGEEFWNNLTDTMITTAISSLFMSGGSAIQMDASTRKQGKNLQQNGDIETVLQIAEGLGTNSYDSKGKYTQSESAAKEIRELQNAGQKISPRQLGKLITAVTNDIGEQNASVLHQVYDEAIEGRLVELGEDEAKAKKLAPVIRQMSGGKKLSITERAGVEWTDAASQVFKELNTEVKESQNAVPGATQAEEGQRTGQAWKTEAAQKAAEATAPIMDQQMLLNKALRTKNAQQEAARQTETDKAVSKGTDMAKAGEGKFTEDAKPSAVAFESSDGEKTGTVTRFKKGKDGMMAIVEVAGADGTTTKAEVSVDDIGATKDAGIGAVISHIADAEARGHDMSEQQASTMLHAYEQEGGDAKAFIDGFEDAYFAGYMGAELGSVGISDGIARIAYEQGKAEAVTDESNRVARATRAKSNSKGEVSFIGKVKSSAEIKGTGDANALPAAMKHMTSDQHATTRIVQEFAKKFKTNVVLFESDADSIGNIENGSYDPNTNTIYIDINSGANTAENIKADKKNGTLGYAMVRTLGHELTHHLESTSSEGYAAYKNAVKKALNDKALKDNGDDWAVLVRRKLDNAKLAGIKLTYAGAEAEVVADASEYILQNSKFIKEIDDSTQGKVKKFIKDFMTKLSDVFKTLTGAHVESAALRQEINGVMQYMGNLQQLWDAAMDESIGREVSAETEAIELSDVNTQFSIREEDPPKKTGIAYKVFFEKNGKLYPPMVANPGGADTPVGVWLNADVGTAAPPSKTGRLQVKAGGKGTQGGSGSLAFRPGWHLGDIPKATQFNRLNKATGVKELFPYNFVWAECEYAMDVDYQEEAMSYGYNANGKFQHSLAGLPRLPVDGYYHYRTNPDPNTVPWVITGAMKVNKILSRQEVDDILREKGVEPTKWQGPDGEQMDADGRKKQYSLREYGLQTIPEGDQNNIKSRGHVVIGSRKELEDFVEKSLSDKTFQSTMYLGNVDKETRIQLEEETGVKLFKDLDYAFGVSSDCVRHLRKHFKTVQEIADAVEIIFEMLKVHDSAIPQRRPDGGHNVILRRNTSEVELESPTWISNRTRSVTVKTAYVTLNNKKRASADQASIVDERDSLGRGGELKDTVSHPDDSVKQEIQKSVREQSIPVEELPSTRQFSLRSSVEKRDDGLMAIHNLNSRKLLDTLRLGGFPMPSIAIVKAKQGHAMYGDYSVIFAADTIDPKGNTDNRVYGNDAWTPIFPPVETELDSDRVLELRRDTKALVDDVDGYLGQMVSRFYNNFVGESVTNETEDSTLEKAWRNEGMLAAYLLENGREVHVLQREVPADRGYKPEYAEIYDVILGVIGDSDTTGMSGGNLLEAYGEQLAAANDILNRMWQRYNAGDRRSGIAILNRIYQAKNYDAAGRDLNPLMETVKDYDATADAMRNQINQDSFDRWMLNNLKQFFKRKGIYNGKERFTSSGNRKSWAATHYAYTVDNVVRTMLQQEESDIPATNASGLKAAASTMYKDLDEIRADSYRLGKVSEEEFNARMAKADNDFRDFLNTIQAWDYDVQEEAGNLLVRAAKKRYKAQEIVGLFKANGFKRITLNAAKIAESVIRQVQTIPTGYFEAKPARVVSFNEVRMVVAPQDMPADLAAKLDELGIPHTSYDGTDADRLEKTNAVEDVKFSLRMPVESVSIREYLGAMQPTSRMNETEKLLLKRYQENIRILDEKEKLVEEQERIIATATGEELTKAKNRLEIYRTQANRARRALTAAERDNGFARLMTTAYSTLNRIPVGTADNVADATDALEKDIATLTSQLKTIEASVSRTATGQKAAFARGLFDRKQLGTVAQALKDTYGSRMSAASIADRLALAYSEIYADSSADGAKRFSEAARSLAEDLIRNNKYRYHSDLLPMLTESIGTISLSETDIQEIKNAGLTVRQYKAMLHPYVKVTANGSDLSSYVSNAEYYGNGTLASIFGDGSEGDYAMRLYETISSEKAKEADNGFEGRSEGQLTMDAMADIAGSLLPLSDNSNAFAQLRSEMLKYAGENAEAAKAVSTAIERAKSTSRKASGVWHAAVKDATLARQAAEYYRNLEEQRRVVELLEQKQMLTEQLRGEAGKLLKASQEKYQRKIDEIREQRDMNLEIAKKQRHIKRIVKRLDDRIRHEEDYKNVKEPLKPAVHKLVRTFIDGFGNMVFDSKTADKLRRVYDEIANDDGAPDFYSNDVANWLTELAALAEQDQARRTAGGSTLESVQQKLDTYSKVAEIADHIYKMVTAADEIFVNGKRESFAAISGEVGGGLVSRKDKALLVGKARDAIRIADDLLRTGNMTPTYFFQHLGNSGLSKLFDGMMNGQTKYAQAIREGQEAVAEAKRKYNFYSWQNMKQGVEFRTEQGHDIALTVPQMMWVYATAKREATNKLMDTHHLDQGGFRYEASDLPRQKGKMSAIPGSDRLHKLSAEDVKKITDTLTVEQKACADELVSYLSNECAEQGNEASMEMFGIKKYKEEYYFPFKTASDQRYQRSDAGSTSTTNDARVKHTSFTHSLRKGANTPLVMGDFFDVISDHINQMATYSSFVVPIESMNRVLNVKVNEEADGSGNDVTVRSLMARKYGEPAQKYVADLMKDLNGGPQTDNRGTVSALFRAFKRGAVMGSLSVALQQPTAIARAFAYINPKYFAHITMEGNKKTWERMMKYSGAAVIKDMGKFDVGTGKMANDWIANSDIHDYKLRQRARFLLDTEGWKAVKNDWIEVLTALPGTMDRITWTHIWKAIEAEQAEENPGTDRNSDEFQRAVGKRFDEVINRTQVYDSILSKSQNMRSKNAFAQMSTAFMAEPTLNINMLYDAVRGNHTAGERAGIITSVVTSSILAAAMASLIAAWNKDDDERKLSEKYLAEFASRAIDSVNPLTMIPYISDIWSMVNGYDIERTDLSVVKDVIDYTASFVSKARDPEKVNTWRDYENFLGTIANLTGVPLKNWSRDARRIRNLFTTDKSASSPAGLKYTLLENITPLGLYADSNKAYCQRLVAAVVDGDTQEAYDLWDYLTNSKKASQSSINTNIRDELKRRVQEGTMTPSQATEILRKYAPYVNDKDNLNKPKEWAE